MPAHLNLPLSPFLLWGHSVLTATMPCGVRGGATFLGFLRLLTRVDPIFWGPQWSIKYMFQERTTKQMLLAIKFYILAPFSSPWADRQYLAKWPRDSVTWFQGDLWWSFISPPLSIVWKSFVTECALHFTIMSLLRASLNVDDSELWISRLSLVRGKTTAPSTFPPILVLSPNLVFLLGAGTSHRRHIGNISRNHKKPSAMWDDIWG